MPKGSASDQRVAIAKQTEIRWFTKTIFLNGKGEKRELSPFTSYVEFTIIFKNCRFLMIRMARGDASLPREPNQT